MSQYLEVLTPPPPWHLPFQGDQKVLTSSSFLQKDFFQLQARFHFKLFLFFSATHICFFLSPFPPLPPPTVVPFVCQASEGAGLGGKGKGEKGGGGPQMQTMFLSMLLDSDKTYDPCLSYNTSFRQCHRACRQRQHNITCI